MATRRYKPEEIVSMLRQAEVLHGQGMSTADAIRQLGISEVTYYRWRKEYGGMSGDQLRRLSGAREGERAAAPGGLGSDAGQADSHGGGTGKLLPHLYSGPSGQCSSQHPSIRCNVREARASLRGRPEVASRWGQGSRRIHLSRAFGKTPTQKFPRSHRPSVPAVVALPHVEARCSVLLRWLGRSTQAVVGSLPQRKSVPSTHMRCRITARRRPTATIAFCMPRRRAMAIPQALSEDHLPRPVIRTKAASYIRERKFPSPLREMRPTRETPPDWYIRGVSPIWAPTLLDLAKRAGLSTTVR